MVFQSSFFGKHLTCPPSSDGGFLFPEINAGEIVYEENPGMFDVNAGNRGFIDENRIVFKYDLIFR